MLRVSRYLLREFALASAAVLIALVVTWVAADTLVHLDDVGDSLRGALEDVVYRLLEVLPLAVPLSCVVGVVWSITRAVRAREITAIRCGGIPLRYALLPVLVAAALIGGALGYFEDRVIIRAQQLRVMGEIPGREDAPRPVRSNGHYWYASGSSVFVAREYDPDTGTLLGVSVFEYGPGRELLRHIDAARAQFVEASTWEFADARIREFRADGLVQRVADGERFDLGLSGADLERIEPPPEVETLHQLAQRIDEEGALGTDIALLETQFHKRIAQPFSVLVLVLLAIPFAIGDVERGDSLPRALLTSVVAAGAFWATWSLALLTANSGTVAPALPLWSAVGLFLAAGLWRFSRVRE